MKKKIIFIGGIWSPDEEENIIADSKGGVQSAANVLQWNLIEGFDFFSDDPVTIVSMKFIGAYPKNYKRIMINAKEFNHSIVKEHRDYDVGFLNLPFIKHYSKVFHTKKCLEKLYKYYFKDEEIYVIGYSMTYSVVKCLLNVKKLNPKAKSCLVIPDLPEYMNLGKNKGILFDFFKRWNNKTLYRDIKSIDAFVLLTKYMYPEFGIIGKPYTVVEGIAASTEIDDNADVYSEKEKKILYTGSLGIKYGICDLVDAFCKISEKGIRLIICGYGDGEEYIKKKAIQDKRIEFLGTVSNKKAKELQKTAYLLVNPRNSKEKYTKFSFPSKTLEYMMSGRPVLMYKLQGIPEEYDDYLFYVNKDLYSSLIELLKMDSNKLIERGLQAKKFVETHKNKFVQTQKILELLE